MRVRFVENVIMQRIYTQAYSNNNYDVYFEQSFSL